MTVYPLRAAQTLALHAQGLARAESPAPTRAAMLDTVRQIGCVQIDTLHVVQRSQYLALWSRLGSYDPADFDALIYGDGGETNTRRLFEYWRHAASIIPLEHYRHQLHAMQHYRDGHTRWYKNWLADPRNTGMVDAVRARITAEGALRVTDFQYDGPKRDSWWDWKPAKRALEYLYDCGECMIADRVNFQRVYDLRERVLPEWVDTSLPKREETRRFDIEDAARALGICEAGQTADYTHSKRTQLRPVIEALRKAGVLVEVQVEDAAGQPRAMVLHRDALPLLEQAASGALSAARTTFLSPFDNLFWARGRDAQLWRFTQVLEAYKPAPQRIWGYFCLPILRRGQLIGRFDPKLDRKTGTLRLKALHLQPGVEPGEALVADVAAAMRSFLRFHDAAALVIEPDAAADAAARDFGAKLLRAL